MQIPAAAILSLLFAPTAFAGTRLQDYVGSAASAAQATRGSSISFHNGNSVITSALGVKLLYYGSWTTADMAVVTGFVSGISATTFWSTVKGYVSTTGSSPVNIGTITAVVTSSSTVVTESTAYDTIKATIPSWGNTDIAILVASQGKLDLSSLSHVNNGVTGGCGFHWYVVTSTTTKDKYAAVGVPSAAIMSLCAAPLLVQAGTSPNGNIGLDAVINTLAHELAESTLNSGGRGYYALVGQTNSNFLLEDQTEIADVCEWNFGTTATAATGNIVVGGRKYLIQKIWNFQSKTCAL